MGVQWNSYTGQGAAFVKFNFIIFPGYKNKLSEEWIQLCNLPVSTATPNTQAIIISYPDYSKSFPAGLTTHVPLQCLSTKYPEEWSLKNLISDHVLQLHKTSQWWSVVF